MKVAAYNRLGAIAMQGVRQINASMDGNMLVAVDGIPTSPRSSDLFNFKVDFRTHLAFGERQFISSLKVHPKLTAVSKIPGEP